MGAKWLTQLMAVAGLVGATAAASADTPPPKSHMGELYTLPPTQVIQLPSGRRATVQELRERFTKRWHEVAVKSAEIASETIAAAIAANPKLKVTPSLLHPNGCGDTWYWHTSSKSWLNTSNASVCDMYTAADDYYTTHGADSIIVDLPPHTHIDMMLPVVTFGHLTKPLWVTVEKSADGQKLATRVHLRFVAEPPPTARADDWAYDTGGSSLFAYLLWIWTAPGDPVLSPPPVSSTKAPPQNVTGKVAAAGSSTPGVPRPGKTKGRPAPPK
jgi:hypothetical protein